MKGTILQVVGSISRLGGGPAYTVRRLSQELTGLGVDVHAVAQRDRFADVDAGQWGPVPVTLIGGLPPWAWGYSWGWIRELERRRPALVHVHGLWMHYTYAAWRWARSREVPMAVSPRGMLEPWALGYRRWKKLPGWWFWQEKAVAGAAILHCTSEAEARKLRRIGISNPVAVVPNGVDLPDLRPGDGRRNGCRSVVFVSRIHPIKGLPLLLEAWARLRPAGWRLIIAGPDECGHEDELRVQARKLGIADSVEFRGPVYGKNKWELLSSADLFVLPSYSENFGVAMAEALACAVPVIATKGTPWSLLGEARCGWWVEPGVDPLAAALEEAMRLSVAERRRMGERGRRLVAERFSWPKIGQQMKEVYEWVLGAGPRPGCVLERDLAGSCRTAPKA